jgi:hypothetical protein
MMGSLKIFGAITASVLLITGCAAEPDVVEETVIDEDLWAVDTNYDWDLFQTGGDQVVIIDLESEDEVDANGGTGVAVEEGDSETLNGDSESNVNEDGGAAGDDGPAVATIVNLLSLPVAGDSVLIGAGSIDVFMGRTFSKGDHVVKVEDERVVLFIAGSSTCTPFPVDVVNNTTAGTKDIIMSPPLLSTPCSSEYRQYFYAVDLSTPVVKGDMLRFCTDTGRCYTLTEVR